jgi:hypothetical protein
MICDTTNLPEPARRRLLDETNHSIAILEDRCRLLDEVIALRQEREALLSSRRGNGPVENRSDDCDRYTPSPYSPPAYQVYHVSPCGARPMPMVLPPVSRYSPQYIPQSTYCSKHHIPLALQPQVVKSMPTSYQPTRPVLIGSRPALVENRDSVDNTPPITIPKLPQTNRKLPSNFRLTPHTVVLGKGKGPKEATGNMRLKELVRESLEEYTGSGRHGKMLVITRIIDQVQSENVYQGRPAPSFVRFQDDGWWEVTEKECRIKLSATFRDLLSDKYRSSSKSKVEYRRQQRQHKREVSDFVDAVRALQTLKA